MFFIKGNCPSLKNSKVKTSRGIFNSKTVSNYLRFLGIKHYSVSKKIVEEYKTRPNDFENYRLLFNEEFKNTEYPYLIGFHFVRKTKADFDFNNINQILADLFTAHDFITDDNMRYFIPFPMMLDNKWYSIDKLNPGVYIKNLNNINN